ncbi:MAG: SAM-dependent methyltransferase, partial [Actinomycetota bacterium]
MLIEVRPVGRLRGEKRVDLPAALGPVLDALGADDGIDLAQLRIVCDWIQYQHNFREPVELRSVLDESETCRLEVALDLRRAATTDLGTMTKAALEGSTERVVLEDWAPGRESCIWRFNELYWQFLALWEEATGQEYEAALPGGESDARNRTAVRELIGELFAVWDGLDARHALPEDLCVLELGVGKGNFAHAFLDEFARLDQVHGRDYHRRLHYFMGDYSPHVLERAQQAVAEHASHTSAMVLDARRPETTLGFLRGKLFLVYLSNVYDNLPTDEVATIGGRPYLVETRAYLPAEEAESIARSVNTEVNQVGSLIHRLLTLGPELLAEASPEHFPEVGAAVRVWQDVWEGVRVEERYAPLDGLASYQPGASLSGELLRPLLEAHGDSRMDVRNVTLSSFAATLPLIHPFGRLRCHD